MSSPETYSGEKSSSNVKDNIRSQQENRNPEKKEGEETGRAEQNVYYEMEAG